MRTQRFDSVGDFLAVAGGFLLAREAEHNLIFGICSTIEADPSTYGNEPPYVAAVLDDERVAGAAIRTPPWRLILSLFDSPAAVELIADDLAGEMLPGAQGPVDVAAAFARAWSKNAGVVARPLRSMRAFRLTSVNPPRAAPGRLATATSADQALVAEWLSAFHAESLPTDPARDYTDLAARWVRGNGRRLVLWIDDGRPVSMTGIGGPTPNGIRVGPVYTPPQLRGRGYASNLVAAASQQELDAGRKFVFLFTDLANPTANHIYQVIGYEPVIDVDEYAFG